GARRAHRSARSYPRELWTGGARGASYVAPNRGERTRPNMAEGRGRGNEPKGSAGTQCGRQTNRADCQSGADDRRPPLGQEPRHRYPDGDRRNAPAAVRTGRGFPLLALFRDTRVLGGRPLPWLRFSYALQRDGRDGTVRRRALRRGGDLSYPGDESTLQRADANLQRSHPERPGRDQPIGRKAIAGP